ncbi:hypothetical protein FRC04_004510 [Tulasnella sp. 424]|nr:hypothetical protein FRC04_004510 [Tulasnella sp. 424]KAG8976579.1 hypothetical protein FRC05_003418 [Tulasnella sp. 425]
MKSNVISLTSVLLAAVPFVVSAPAPATTSIHECPLVDIFLYADPFEATALPGYYLESAKNVAVLVKGQPENTFAFDEAPGPLGLWGAGPTVDGCAGYSYLNPHGSLAASTTYSALTYDAVSTTTWNTTIGSDLTKLGFPKSSDFLACKRPKGSRKKGAYVLFLQNPGVVSALSSTSATTLDSGDGDVLQKSSCVSTKIHIVPAA